VAACPLCLNESETAALIEKKYRTGTLNNQTNEHSWIFHKQSIWMMMKTCYIEINQLLRTDHERKAIPALFL
jgi:hypothetical protein